jgi:hypothetical protein
MAQRQVQRHEATEGVSENGRALDAEGTAEGRGVVGHLLDGAALDGNVGGATLAALVQIDDLDGVLSFGLAAQDAERQGVHRRPMAFEQYPQARGIASLGRHSEPRIARHGGSPSLVRRSHHLIW